MNHDQLKPWLKPKPQASVLNLKSQEPFWHEDEEFWPEIDRHDPKYSAEGVDKWTFRRAGKSKKKNRVVK